MMRVQAAGSPEVHGFVLLGAAVRSFLTVFNKRNTSKLAQRQMIKIKKNFLDVLT